MIQISQVSELSKITNYNDKLEDIDVAEYIIKYISVLFDLLEYAKKDKYKYKRDYLNYILKQAFATMQHIFTYMLMYTKNVDLSFFHLQKGLYYYLEFIQQIKRDEHQFLQFNIKDAIIFVYKKTIYDIDSEYIRQHIISENDKKIMHDVREYIEEWNLFIFNLIQLFIHEEKFDKISHKDLTKIMILICKTKFDKDIMIDMKSILNYIKHVESSNIIDELYSIAKNLNQYKK